jgi:hypothetical protein
MVWLTGRRFEQDKIAQQHFCYQMVATDLAPNEGGQVDVVLARILCLLLFFA